MKPLLVYDGDCGFCRRWIERWRETTRDRVEYAPYQEVAARFPHIPLNDFKESVQYIEPDGRTSRAAEAVFRSLATVPSCRWMLWLYSSVPGVHAVSEIFYRLVARRRAFFSRITHFFWGEDLSRPTYTFSSSFFLRMLGLIYLIAFVSFGCQVLGLVGSQGIVPARDFLDAVHQALGTRGWWEFPTLAWLNSSDTFLQILCWAGAVWAGWVLLGILPSFFIFLCWLFYL
jgi:predicted DCC family thiol-disulfide oxidoreductase YuxK